MKKFFGSIVLLLSMLACGSTASATPSQAELETIVAATLESLTAAAPTTVDGTGIAINNISLASPRRLVLDPVRKPLKQFSRRMICHGGLFTRLIKNI
jgi:hypothetical protein